MATVNGFLLTKTNQEYFEHPHQTMNAGTHKVLTQAIAATDIDSAADLLSVMKIPDGCKIEKIEYSLTQIDSGSDSNIDIVILENIDGTATTTKLHDGGGALGQAATTVGLVWPTAANGTYIHQVAATDDGYGVIQLLQVVSRSATTGTLNIAVYYG